MKPLNEQLAEAYRREEKAYSRILELVREQLRVMSERPDPRAVMQLCAKVEELMEEIGAIEEAIEPAKAQWQQDRSDPDGALAKVLASIESVIEQITATQEMVQRSLLQYLQAHQAMADGARASLNASRARKLYRAG